MNSFFSRSVRLFFMPDEPPAGAPESVPAPANNEPSDAVSAAQLTRALDDLATARAELQAIKDAELSEVDRLKRQTSELESRLHASEADLLRRRIALEENVPSDALEYLNGGDEDTLRLSAKKLVTLIGSKTVTAGSRTQPGAGQAPSIDEQIAAAEKSGNRALSISLKSQKLRAT